MEESWNVMDAVKNCGLYACVSQFIPGFYFCWSGQIIFCDSNNVVGIL
jgi:hypothetical protein